MINTVGSKDTQKILTQNYTNGLNGVQKDIRTASGSASIADIRGSSLVHGDASIIAGLNKAIPEEEAQKEFKPRKLMQAIHEADSESRTY